MASKDLMVSCWESLSDICRYVDSSRVSVRGHNTAVREYITQIKNVNVFTS